MNQATPQIAVPEPNSWHMIRAMGGVGLLCAVLIVSTFELTKPAIERNRAAYLEKAIFKVLPGATTRETFALTSDNRFQIAGATAPGRKIYAGYNADNKLVGLAIEASGQGFMDAIHILYGYAPDRDAVVGIEVLESKETPGLGDKIEKDEDFLKNFEALDVSLGGDGQQLANPIVSVKKGEKENPWEIDAITGATISSKAIATILRQSTGEWVPVIAQHVEQFRK